MGLKILRLLAVAVVFYAAASCKVDDSQREYANVAAEGYYVYRVTAGEVVSPVLLTLDVALKADLYVKADQYGRYDIEDRYFQRYKVRLYEDSCVLEDNYAVIEFDGMSITEPGAVWTSTVQGVKTVITCTGENEWNVAADLSETVLADEFRTVDEMDMSVKAVQDEEFTYIVDVSGVFFEVEDSGTDRQTFTEVTFAVSGPTKAVADIYRYGMFHFYDGGFNMHLDIAGYMERSEDIKVSLSAAKENTVVTVDYKGETGYWRE